MAYPSAAGLVPSPSLATRAVRPIKRAIAGQVVALFNDRTRGETPVGTSTAGEPPSL